MNIVHFIIGSILYSKYLAWSDEFTHPKLHLIFQREGLEWIVETINHIHDQVEIYGDEPMEDIYDMCDNAITEYLL